jgi:hypothetical protein
MPSVLHPNTVRALVEYICDIGGPHERPSWRLSEFFRSAGWEDVPDYDGPSRPQWVAQRLNERSGNRTAIEQVLRQLCDQREYDSPQDAASVRDVLNGTLAREGLRVDYRGGRPVVEDILPPTGFSAGTTPVELTVDLGRIISDRRMVELLRSRLREASLCREYDAHFAAIVTLGSLLEGALFAVLEQDTETRERLEAREGGKGRRPRLSLSVLIELAHGRGFIARDAKDFANVLREYRNFVHPRAQLEFEATPDADTVNVCWNVAVMTLNDLGNALSRGSG